MHNESTAGGTFSFPPSEQPTHAARRSVIAALQQVKDKNSTISDTNQKDWVSIVTFDKSRHGGPARYLTSNYGMAMQRPTMQAVGYNGNSTATETGLLRHTTSLSQQPRGPGPREYAESRHPAHRRCGESVFQQQLHHQQLDLAHPSSNYYGGAANTRATPR